MNKRSKRNSILPGAILCRKKYGMLTKLWHKITGKSLDYNEFVIITNPLDLLSVDVRVTTIYEPVRRYCKQELDKLAELVAVAKPNTFAEIKVIVDKVRPNTFDDVLTLDDCKYYKKRDLHANTIERIHPTKQ